MIEYKTIKLSKTICYLIKAKTGYMLIDCGSKHDAYALLKALHALGLTLKDIQYLLLTHHHSDHCGLLPFLIAENPGILVIMSENCANYLKTGVHHTETSERYASPLLRLTIGAYLKFSKSIANTFEPFEPRPKDYVLSGEDDQLLPKIGIDAKILPTPGHTEDSISVIADKTAFVGDAARNMLNFAGAAYRPIILYDIDKCNQSLLSVLEQGVSLICPAHGEPFDAQKLDFLKHKTKEIK